MQTILEMLSERLGPESVESLSRSLGTTQETTSRALAGGIPLLLAALGRNASAPGGAQALLAALDRDHDGSIIDDLAGFLGGGGLQQGEGVLGHVFGQRQQSVEAALGGMSGLDAQGAHRLLALLAPVVLGMLARTKQERGLDAGGLGEMLGGERQHAEQSASDAMALLGRVLDSNADGSVMDDLARIGSDLLGGLFGPRR